MGVSPQANEKRQNGRLVADYFDQAGKRHIKTFERERDARAWLAETLVSVKQETHTPESASITVAEAANLWIEKCEAEHLERSTLRQYQDHVGCTSARLQRQPLNFRGGGCRWTPTAPERCCVRVMRW
jgi:hypothetical protein